MFSTEISLDGLLAVRALHADGPGGHRPFATREDDAAHGERRGAHSGRLTHLFLIAAGAAPLGLIIAVFLPG